LSQFRILSCWIDLVAGQGLGHAFPRLEVTYDRWLAFGSSPDELRALLRPYDADLMEGYAVSRVVNSVKNDTEECIQRVA
jgi:hypothetical protein